MKKIVICLFALSSLILTNCNNQSSESTKQVEVKDSVIVLKTIDNLKAGIKGETTASAKYAAFAQKAKEEKFPQIALLFEAASKAESIHAANHTVVLEKMGGKMDAFTPEFEVKTTAENLQAAYDGETYEINEMYPKFLAEASIDKAEDATQTFTYAIETEKKHQAFYQKAIEALKDKKIKELPSTYYVCPVCGNTFETANVPEFCELCATPKDKFFVIK